MKLTSSILKLAVVILAGTCLAFLGSSSVNAADARNFNAGRIIDDGIFSNSNSMSVDNIQSFLNSKVTCDTWGQKQSELGGGTRAQWLASRGISTPITCLRDYYENPATAANNYGKAIPPGGISAAQIIYNYSQQFSINPQVIIATLQKENGLITDEWPTPKQYSEAMGFGCPDNVAPGAPACDPSYGSFSAQIYQAARHFRGYVNNSPGWFVPFSTGDNTIRWSPNAACGSSVVNIQNRATVALYSYTPYRPNQAALNAQYGTGDGCSAYGNRNFYLYFTDWFGSTYGGDPVSTNIRLVSPIATTPANPVAGQTISVSYTVKNFGASDVNYDNTVLQCRFNSTTSCDPPYGGSLTLPAGASKTITSTLRLHAGGNFNLVPFFLNGGIWYRYGVESTVQNNKLLTIPDLALVSPITTSGRPVIGQPLTVSYTVRNYGTQPAFYQDSVLQCTYELYTSCDPPSSGPITLTAGEYRTFTHTLTPSADGRYVLTPYFRMNDNWYTYTSASTPGLAIVASDLRLTGDITTSPVQPVPGQAMTVSYTIKNFGIKPFSYTDSVLQCRIDTSVFCDPANDGTDTLDPGESKTFSEVVPSVRAGSYRLIPYFKYDGSWYEFDKGAASSNIKVVEVPRYVADMRLVSEITTTPADPIPGEPIAVTYRVKNFGTLPAVYQDSVLQCRFNVDVNCDSSYSGVITIEPGEEREFNYTVVTAAKVGTYNLIPYYLQNGAWHRYANGTASTNSKRLDIQPYAPDLRLTGDIAISPSQPSRGQTTTATYTLRNFGNRSVSYSYSVLQCRLNTLVNCDPSWDAGVSLAPGESKTFSTTLSLQSAGSYRLLPYYFYNGAWFEFSKGVASSNIKLMTVQ